MSQINRTTDSWFSDRLGREMEIVRYGSGGPVILLFPSAGADYLEYERFYLIDSVSRYLEERRLRIFSINSINNESWLNHEIEPRKKAVRHQEYNGYIENEVFPYIWTHAGHDAEIYSSGVSLGAFHAVNVLCRRPDLLSGAVAMSGIYDLKAYASGYFDEDVYFNSPVDYLPNLEDRAILDSLRSTRIHLLSGSGPYEDPGATSTFSEILTSREIPHRVEIWGPEWGHDWPTWRAMFPSYLDREVLS